MLTVFLYRIAVKAYTAGISLAAFFSTKAALWYKGRIRWEEKLKKALAECPRKGPLIWVHCASLGEFEQGRPLLEALREQEPETRILLTFFSPSGYELRKNYAIADYVCYLPTDSPRNAKRWLDICKPDKVFFVKYEFWYDYLQAIHCRKIPLFLVSGIFRPSQAFFKPWGALFRKMLGFFTCFFVQNEASAQLLQSIGLTNSIVCGDTRMDRVLSIQQSPKALPLIDLFCGQDRPILVCGSTWPADEQIVGECWKKDLQQKKWKLIIAPHEIEASKIQALEAVFAADSPTLRYSEATTDNIAKAEILIIDNIGMLSQLYRYAKAAYIGGGFGKGIHNTLEAVVYKIPVYFGPKHKKFAEAQDLLSLGVAMEIKDAQTLAKGLQCVDYASVATKAATYIETQKGATAKILASVQALFSFLFAFSSLL